MIRRFVRRSLFRPCVWALSVDCSLGLWRFSRSEFPRPVALCRVPLVGGPLVKFCFWVCSLPE